MNLPTPNLDYNVPMHFHSLKSICYFLTASLLFAATGPLAIASASSAQDRQAILDYSRRSTAAALGQKTLFTPPPSLNGAGPWCVSLTIYDHGAQIAQSDAGAASPAEAIRAAAAQLADGGTDLLNRLPNARFFITVRSSSGEFSLVEYRGKALEIAAGGDITAVRSIDPPLIRQKIREQRDYLLRQMHPHHHAFFKRYDARLDQADPDLRTIYTASSLWTLLLMNDLEKDERIVSRIRPIARFLLSMQVKDGDHRGAFYYSKNSSTGKNRARLVVGTASKTIFTLLELYRRTGNKKYLRAAQNAGDWLVRQTVADGRVFPVVRKSRGGQWKTLTPQSVLYSGQVLTALSRLYQVTPKSEYRNAADRIAVRLLKQAEDSRYFVGDEFRPPNTISTSWLAMAFLSYSHINPDPAYRRAVYLASHKLIEYQIRDFSNILDDGRYKDTKASSGNGWINEVLVEVYRQSAADGRLDSDDYTRAVTRTTRWLIQNMYSYENSYHIPNPARARGGSIRDSVEEAVRTDAVCHGGNSLIGYLDILGDNARFSIRE